MDDNNFRYRELTHEDGSSSLIADLPNVSMTVELENNPVISTEELTQEQHDDRKVELGAQPDEATSAEGEGKSGVS